MLFEYAYAGSSSVANSPDATAMSFAPDLKRKPTFFRGELRQSVPFREAISALHEVVVSDLRWKPKDKSEYKAWAEQQLQIDWTAVNEARADVKARIQALLDEQRTLTDRYNARMRPYWEARSRFYAYVAVKEHDLLWLFDPVITVHPDEVFFECFSKDESSYARLGAGFEVFKNVGEFSCGTTNVDYSRALYDEFQKVRSYKTTTLDVDPSGFEVATSGGAAHKEVKIDLPDSWVRGFLQVNSAMALPTTSFELDPMDLHNVCFVLRRHRERKGPRSMRYHLVPGEPVKIVFEPWGIEVTCARSRYEGPTAETVRVWGRRRLLTLERLIPVAKRVTVHLLGTGMPSFYVVDLGDMTFTLGLSGWTTNDWASAANFDLLAPRMNVDAATAQRVFAGLNDTLYESPDALSKRIDVDRATVLGALGAYTQAGRAMFDLNKRVYRVRELTTEPLPLEELRFANPREESATRLLGSGAVVVAERNRDANGSLSILGAVTEGARRFDTALTTDTDERILRADCTCNWHQQNKLRKGPCEHILALRLAHARSVL